MASGPPGDVELAEVLLERVGVVAELGRVLARSAPRCGPARGGRRARRGGRSRAGRSTAAGRRRGRLHSAPKASRLGTRMSSSSDGRPGDRQVVLPERAAGHVPDHRARRSSPPSSAASPAASARAWPRAGRRPSPRSGSSSAARRRRPRRQRRARRPASRAAAGSRRACAAPTAPRVTGRTRELAAGDRRREAGDVGDVQLGHPGQLLERDALDRVDVGLARVVGGDGERQVAGRVPRHARPRCRRASWPGRRRGGTPRRGWASRGHSRRPR